MPATSARTTTGSSELSAALGAVKRHFLYAAGFSAAVNILLLVPILYMLHVYDRVLASGSLSTLGMLTLLAVALLMAMGAFEWVRSCILVAAGNRIEYVLRKRIFHATFRLSLLGGNRAGAQAVHDLTGLRQFLTGNGIFAFFDAPWFPVYTAVMFLFHPWFGVSAVFAGVVMAGLACLNESLTHKTLKEANTEAGLLTARLSGSLRNAEVLEAMGMAERLRNKFQIQNDKVLQLQTHASSRAGAMTAITRAFRMIMQSLVLGLGAWLALRQEISPGSVIAGSLLLGRALAPIDVLVASGKVRLDGADIGQWDRGDLGPMSATCRRTSNCARAVLRKISAVSVMWIPTRLWPPHAWQAYMN